MLARKYNRRRPFWQRYTIQEQEGAAVETDGTREIQIALTEDEEEGVNQEVEHRPNPTLPTTQGTRRLVTLTSLLGDPANVTGRTESRVFAVWNRTHALGHNLSFSNQTIERQASSEIQIFRQKKNRFTVCYTTKVVKKYTRN